MFSILHWFAYSGLRCSSIIPHVRRQAARLSASSLYQSSPTVSQWGGQQLEHIVVLLVSMLLFRWTINQTWWACSNSTRVAVTCIVQGWSTRCTTIILRVTCRHTAVTRQPHTPGEEGAYRTCNINSHTCLIIIICHRWIMWAHVMCVISWP